MDPRLNPTSNQPQQRPVVQDIRAVPANPALVPPPAPQVQTPASPAATVTQPMAPQIVDSIPVHQQDQTPVAASPVNPINPTPPINQAKGPQGQEDELDSILQAVNSRVKQPLAVKPSKKAAVTKKVSTHAGKLGGIFKGSKPIGAILITLVIVSLLTTAAVVAYRQEKNTKLASQPGKVGTSYIASDAIQQAGGTLVRPADLDDYSGGLQTKLDSLNDSQDFNAAPLSDQTLGL